jgi:hypothetical protein
MKKTVFYGTGILCVFMVLVEVNALGILPYTVALFWMYQSIFQKKNRVTALGVMAGIMALLNLVLAFDDAAILVDVIAWVIILSTYGVNKNA